MLTQVQVGVNLQPTLAALSHTQCALDLIDAGTLCIAFDDPDRQKQYTEAVTSFLQCINRPELSVEIVTQPVPCSFLLYVTYTSGARMVNFDVAAFRQFTEQCSTGW